MLKKNDESIRSRSVSPEIPKIEEPGQYKMQLEVLEESENLVQSGPSTPKTPKSTNKKCSKIETEPSSPSPERPAISRRASRILSGLQDSPGFRGMKSSAVDIGLSSPKTPRSTSKRSSMIQSGPTTPKTPRSLTKRALAFTREDSPLKMTFVAIDKEDSRQKSTRSSSAQATPKTPKGTPNRTTKNKAQKLSSEEEEEKDTSFESPIS
jgi:hypothetical protein